MPSELPTDCSHRPTCPGCPNFGAAGVASAPLQRLAALADRLDAEFVPESNTSAELSRAFGHRHRARLMVRGRANSPKVGIFQAGSHKIADIPRCHVHHPSINAVARMLKESIRASQVEPYADVPHRGCVRALQIVVERRSARVQVVVVTNDASRDRAAPLLGDLERRLRASNMLHSLWWNGNSERTNTILGPRFELVAHDDAREPGAERGWVTESIGGADVFFPPAAFGQSHLPLADVLVARVHQFAAGAANVAEFYAGCGSIGLGLFARGAAVAFNEQNPAGIAGLRRGIAEQGGDARARVVAGDAGDALVALDGADVAIVDPPRKGLDVSLRAALARGAAPRLAYVSCGLDSLERDLTALTEHGQMRLVSLEPFALFPFTDHVETLATLERR